MIHKITRTMALLALLATAATSHAASISVTVGDNDGYGFGVADNGTAVWPCYTCYDGRSAAETAATNGAQLTDVYATLFPGAGPINVWAADVIFPFVGTLTSASVTVDMGDFQIPSYMDVYFNGILQAGLFAYNDGFEATAVRTFVLDSAALAAANAAGQFVMRLDGSRATDYVAFDYFQLNGTTSDGNAPEPGTLALLGLGLAGLATLRRRKH